MDTTQINFDKIFEQIIMPWFYNKPIFFKLFCSYKIRQNPEIPIPFRTGKNIIEYNQLILKEESFNQLRDELLLELQRILLRHPFRRPKDLADFDRALWYEASTLTITQKGIEFYGFEYNQSIEYYYKELVKYNKEEQNNEEEEDIDCPPITSGESIETTEASSFFSLVACDDEDSNESEEEALEENETENSDNVQSEKSDESNKSSDTGSATDEQVEAFVEESQKQKEAENKKASELWSCDDEEMEQEISRFISENNRNWGNTPANIKQMIALTKKARIPSYINLLEYFKGFRGRGDRAATRMRPSRRFGYEQMGYKSRAVPGKILIGVDVSGSITDEIIGMFYGAIRNIFDKSIKYLDVFQFDYALKTEKPVPFKKRSLIPVTGRGGTNFQPIFDYAIKNQNAYDGLIIFTDGNAPEPVIHHKLRTKVLWVLITAEDYEACHKVLEKTGLVTAML